MYPFWDLAIEPLLTAAGARRVVEIGALRGETTVRLLAELGDGAELHVIDPAPAFDPTEHERAFGGRYVFHRDISHAVLPTLEPVDAALVDGDHNWFTVYHELRMLRDTARAAGRPLPLLILHDVGWPYGRRDLYYVPERIPADQRQPFERRGIRPGEPGLLEAGGMNTELANAVVEGGPRNGVMTALEDFLAEHDEPTRLAVLPVYYGLAIVAEEGRLAETPALAERLDWLEGPEGQAALATLAEDVRLDATVVQQEVLDQMEGRLRSFARRYLDLLRHELEVDAADAPLLSRIHGLMATVRSENVGGDLLAVGAVPPPLVAYLRGFLEAFDLPFQRVAVAADAGDDRLRERSMIAPARAALHGVGLADARVRFLCGPLRPAMADAGIQRVALACVDVEAGGSLEALLDDVDAHVVTGGFVMVTGKVDAASDTALDAWLARRAVDDRWNDGSAVGWRKTGPAPVPGGDPTSRAVVPLLPALWIGRLPVSVVIGAADLGAGTRTTVRAVAVGEQIGSLELEHEVVVGVRAGSVAAGDGLPGTGPRLRVVEAAPGRGVVGAANDALRTARGDAVLVVAAGDRPSRGVLRAALSALAGRTDRIVAVPEKGGTAPGALLVPRQLLEQHGCLDERVPGMAEALQDLVDRLATPMGVDLVDVVDESVRRHTDQNGAGARVR